ncbi:MULTISPECIES: carboxylesterase [unclassified Limnothrix]|uniref:alpha/beta hydrolase n=1 Tax=unclassified Limnothrix TaxID=2632864 RepID=UPI001A7EB730|nr:MULTISPECIES: alpha/beta fold hydrolase [unclassified Limnothrix]
MATPLSARPYLSGFEALSAQERAQLHPDAVPFQLAAALTTAKETTKGRSRGVVICLHGFTAMPYGVGPVARAIAQQGLDVVAPLLPGHGWRDRPVQEREIAKITPDRLLAAARDEVRRAREQYDFVAMYGDSMGGAIALILAAEGLLDACAVTAPALQLPFRGAVLARYLGWLNFSIPKRLNRRFYAPCYEFENARAGRVLWRLSRRAKAGLERITCPVFVAHSHADRTIAYQAAEWVRDRVAGPVELQWFDRSGHVLPLDVEGPAVATAISQFFQQQFSQQQFFRPLESPTPQSLITAKPKQIESKSRLGDRPWSGGPETTAIDFAFS